MRRLFPLACLVALVCLPACGGDTKRALGCCRSNPKAPPGGGGGTAGNVVTVIREGDDEPAPNAGTFGAIPTKPMMDVAVLLEDDPGYDDFRFPGVYACFVLPVALGQTSRDALYVRQPDATLVRVIGVGEDLPGTGGGIVNGFEQVWMCAEGTAVFGCTISGGSGDAGFGVFARQVTGGGVGDVIPLMLHTQILSGMGSEVTFIDYASGFVTQPVGGGFVCRFYVLLTNGSAQSVIYAVNTDGSDPAPVLSPVTTRVQGLPVLRVDAFGVSNGGELLAAVVQLDEQVGTDPVAMISTRTLDLEFLYRIVATEGDEFDTGLPAPADTGTVGEIYADGPIFVTSDGAIAWKAEVSPLVVPPPGTPLDLVLLGQEEGNALKSLCTSGTSATPGTTGTFGTLTLLDSRVSTTNGLWPVLHATILGDPAVTAAIFAIDRPAPADPATYVGVALEGDGAGGGTLGSVFSLGTFEPGGRRDSTRRSSDTVFVNSITGGDAASGLFRARPDGTILSIALEGDAIPNQGVRYGPVTAQTTTQGAVLFRAVILTSTSGLFLETYTGG